MRSSSPEYPAKFHHELIHQWGEERDIVSDRMSPAAIPHNKQICLRPNRPAQSIIDAHLSRFRVVLRKARQDQLCGERIDDFRLQQALHEITERQTAEIIFGLQLELQSTGRLRPRDEVLHLRQVTGEELAKPDGPESRVLNPEKGGGTQHSGLRTQDFIRHTPLAIKLRSCSS